MEAGRPVRRLGCGRKLRLGGGGESGSWGARMCLTGAADRSRCQVPQAHLQHFPSSHKPYREASGLWQSSWILGTTEEESMDLCPLKGQPVSLARRTGWGLKMQRIGAPSYWVVILVPKTLPFLFSPWEVGVGDDGPEWGLCVIQTCLSGSFS